MHPVNPRVHEVHVAGARTTHCDDRPKPEVNAREPRERAPPIGPRCWARLPCRMSVRCRPTTVPPRDIRVAPSPTAAPTPSIDTLVIAALAPHVASSTAESADLARRPQRRSHALDVHANARVETRPRPAYSIEHVRF